MSASDEVRKLLDAQLEDLARKRDELKRALASVEAALAQRMRERSQLDDVASTDNATFAIGRTDSRATRMSLEERKEQVLEELDRAPQGLRIVDIAERVGVKQPRASQLVAALERDRRIVRRDGRVFASR